MTLESKVFRCRVETGGAVVETDDSKTSGKRPAKLYRATKLPRNFAFPRPLGASQEVTVVNSSTCAYKATGAQIGKGRCGYTPIWEGCKY